MVVRDIEMARRRLPQRADAKDHAVLLPPFLVDFQNRNAGGGACQPRLEPAGRLLAAKLMRNRNDERCGHFQILKLNLIVGNSTLFEGKRKPDEWQREDGTLFAPICFFTQWQSNSADCRAGGRRYMSIGTIILIILVIALLGGFSGCGGGPFYGTGYYGGGGLRLIVSVLLFLLLLRRILTTTN